MKRILVAAFMVLVSAVSVGRSNPYNPDSAQSAIRPRVALVLSGGGAKGMAHIGVLRVLERAGIPVDIICGTSMGALVGGLYSIGYDAATLDSLVHVQDWGFLLSDRLNPKEQSLGDRAAQDRYFYSLPLSGFNRQALSRSGLIKGQNLANLFNRLTVGYHDSISFDSLPVPFACVATDMVKYGEVDFRGGYLATAMRASMSIPAAFTPVRLDTMVLVDGGLRNNYPADVARDMGADYVIGVSVQKEEHKTADDFNSAGAVLTQLIDVNCENKYRENWAITDIPIRVDVDGYSMASFNLKAIDTLIARGERAAMEHWDSIIGLKRRLGYDDDYRPAKISRYQPMGAERKVRVAKLDFRNVSSQDTAYLCRRYSLSEGDSVSIMQIEKAIGALRGTLFYNDAGYQLTGQPDGYRLTIDTEGRKASEILMGIRFDNEEKVALQFHGIFPLRFKPPVRLGLTGRLGKRSMGRVEATVSPTRINSFKLSYTFRYNDINIYHGGNRKLNFTYNRHTAELGLLSLSWRNIMFDISARYDYYDYRDMLSSGNAGAGSSDNDRLLSYRAMLNYNSQDNDFFTTRGSRFEAEYAIYTDNMYQYDGHTPFGILSARWRTALRLTDRFSLGPRVYGRALMGRGIPYVMGNFIGGPFFGHYIEHQMPFAGFGNVERASDVFVGLECSAQQRVMDNNYLSLTFSAACHDDKFGNLFRSLPMAGARFDYAYDSMIGPLGASLGYSSRTNSLYMYVNLGFEF